MRLENMKNEFPKMPEEMRAMIEQEVKMQIETIPSIRFRVKKSFIAVLVATMALGTTVFAGALYRMHSEPVGKYGVETKVESTTDGTTPDTLPQIPAVKMELGYIPEGMVEGDKEKSSYYYEDSMYLGGISFFFYRMDTGDDKFEVLDTDVLSSENITIGEHDGIYLLFDTPNDDTITFNQRIYVAYTDVHYVMEMFVGSDVTKEDAIKIAEDVKLIPVENAEEDTVYAWDWSYYISNNNEAEKQNETAESSATVVSKDRMANTHTIGESFALTNSEINSSDGLMVKVADVQISDDISLLDEAYMDEDLKKSLREETNAEGKLLPATIKYMKLGDGINTLNETVSTREVPQKLVYATVEYTNTGTSELSEVLFCGGLLKIAEAGNQMTIYKEQPQVNDDWDIAQLSGVAQWREMPYCDVHGGERRNNYITSIKPGETATVHMAWVVPEEELEYLYLNLDSFEGYEFDSHALAIGYVDIRQ